jgi:hypothetical protein
MDGIEIKQALLEDVDMILQLQIQAYLSETEIYNDYSIPVLIQSFNEIKQEFSQRHDYYLNLRCHSCFAFAFIAATTTITTSQATATKNTMYRLGHTDKWACRNCKIEADKHFMQKHSCGFYSRIQKYSKLNTFS